MTQRPGPETLYIEVTNRCNLRCTTCPCSFEPASETRDLTPDEVIHILAEVPSAGRIVLHGIGEPLLHPAIVDIVRLAKERERSVLFNTNATLLTPGVSPGLIDSGLDELRVSIDAPRPDLYRALRRGAELSSVLDNVHAFVQTRGDRRKPRISFWMTAGSDRIGLLPDLVRLAASVGVEEAYLQRLVISGRGSATEREAVYGRQSDDALTAVEEAERVAREVGVRLWGSGNVAPGVSVTSENAAIVRPWTNCYRPERTAYVRADGSMLPCCVAPFVQIPVPEEWILGNILETPFEQIWNGERYEVFRNAFASDRPWACCQRCGLDWSL